MKENSVAVLMPVASLVGGDGIGDFGESSRNFVDQLAAIGVQYWQVLPLGLLDQYGCPYASPSAFGLEPLLIDQSILNENTDQKQQTPQTERINYAQLALTKRRKLNEMAQNKIKDPQVLLELKEFERQKFWIKDLTCFLALSEKFGRYWTKWPSAYKNYDHAMKFVENELHNQYLRELYLQKVALEQWQSLKKYASDKGVQIIGDLPIFVSIESFDSWRWGEIFKRERESGLPMVITGAPPDPFSENGQLWGTLNYQWQKETQKVLWWWSERMKDSLELYDLVRIDHFIGLYHVWESGPLALDAREGGWVKSEGEQLLEMLQNQYPDMPFIAEDLGALSDEVRTLRQKFNLPSMKVFQFAIDENKTNEHLPEMVPKHSIYYSATHDNNTLIGWLSELLSDSDKRNQLASRLNMDLSILNLESASDRIHEVILASKANCCVFQLQDIMKLDACSRINVPGTLGDNWNWKMSATNWNPKLWHEFAEKLKTHSRSAKG